MIETLCQCGCGHPAPIAGKTRRKFGHVKGEPMRYRKGHATRKRPAVDEAPRPCACGCGRMTSIRRGVANRYIQGHNHEVRPITETDYMVEDKGFETPCWIWVHPLDLGRGQVGIKGKKRRAYLALYEQEIGPIPEGKVAHHRCEQPACVRPDHLEFITQSDHIHEHGIPGWNRITAPPDD